jgi:uncharacterized protein YfaS (alpha-2-macroglobulin family)
MTFKRLFCAVCAVIVLLSCAAPARADDTLAAGDKFAAEKSYRLAEQEYAKLMGPEAGREIRFKWADSAVRSKDDPNLVKAEKLLKELAEGEDHDRWRAESGATLAEEEIARNPYGEAQHIRGWLEDARDYWAGASDVDLAREKFVALSFTLADFDTTRWGWYVNDIRPIRLGGKSGVAVPQPGDGGNAGLQTLFEEILKVAAKDADKAHAHYGLGMALLQGGGDEKRREKGLAELAIVTSDFRSSDWADQSWYQTGMALENAGDYVKAAAAYGALLERYKPGFSQWLPDAKRRLAEIVDPAISVNVGQTFVPGSEAQFGLTWRNIKRAKFTLYRLDLAQELQLKDDRSGYTGYNELLNLMVEKRHRLSALTATASWEAALDDDGKHAPHNGYKGMAEWRAEKDAKPEPKAGQLEPGAYVLLAEGGGKQAYDLVLVTDLALVAKTSKDAALFFAADAKTGKPQEKAVISYLYSYTDAHGTTLWALDHGETDADGLFRPALRDESPANYQHQHNLFAVVSSGGHQAFVQSNYYQYYYNNKGEWWLYAFGDRPAYRPGETVSFKAILRHPDHGAFDSAAGMEVKARIYDAQGNQVKEGKYTLNAYGAFDDTLELGEKAVLGQYRIDVFTADNSRQLAQTPLFSLEEYKLPEFKVAVSAEPREGKTPGYRLGDTVKVAIDAQYYFGGPVADAEVEYLVYRQNYQHQVLPVRPYGWYYEDMYPRIQPYGYGELVTQKKIRTGADGKAHFTIETPKDSPADLQYRVEARVVDRSRREIRGTAELKVTRNAFFASLEAKQSLYRPGDKATVTLRTMTAEDAPVSVEGKITVMKNTWAEGNKVAGGGYAGQEMFTKFVKTDAKGEASFDFEPDANGYYTVAFTGFDEDREVKAEAQVFVCDSSATNIGYRYGGLQIILEKDTYQPGDTAHAMIVSDKPDTYVLLDEEAHDLFGARVLHLEGSVKLVDIPIAANYTPNIFVAAYSADHYQVKAALAQIVVPPEDKFLTVKISSDKEIYQPREAGTFSLEVTDKSGKPVNAEIALGLVDASVYYIHDDYAPDIRKFFYGDKRQQVLQTQTSFQQRPYVQLVRADDGSLITEDERSRRKRSEGTLQPQNEPVDELDRGAYEKKGAVLGGMLKDGAMRSTSAPAPAAAAKSALAEDKEQAENKLEAGKPQEERQKQLSVNGAAAGTGGSADEPPAVREDFRSTVIWQPAVKTDAQGRATVHVVFPDSLTTWRMTSRAVTPETAVGAMIHEVQSNKDLMVRLEAPRFFTERDLADVAALVDNLTDKPVTLAPSLKAEGVVITGLYRNGEFVKGEAGPVEVPAHGQARVDWAVSAPHAGTAVLTVTAGSGKMADAMRKSYPVIPHGIEKFIARAAALKGGDGEQTAAMTISLPKERIREASSLRISLSPSLAGNLLDALPYLADYPYGCVEQTMSRFLPAVIVRKTMRDLGLSQADVETYVAQVLERRGDPKGHPQRREDATLTRLDAMTQDGLKRLYDFQHTDGGWGWWKEGDSDRFMTAYVVWGLGLAREAGLDVRSDVPSRASEYLENQLVMEADHPDMLAWMLHALAYGSSSRDTRMTRQLDRLWNEREKLNPYTRALFALTEHKLHDAERARVLAGNIIDGLSEDKDNGTAHWGESGVNYRWSEGGVEATAFNIAALSKLDPQSPSLAPAVKWMALNRRGASWKNTRDTAIAVLCLTEYLKATQELAPDYAFKVLVNGTVAREGKVDAGNVLSFDRYIDIPAEQLRDGDNEVKVVMSGNGALYAAAYAKYFTLEEPITKAGNEIFVTRKYFAQSVKETLLKGYTNDWKEIKDGDTVHSGDRIRVDVTLEAKNNYEYLLAEDYKPAGLEAVALNSGAGEAIALDNEGRETESHTPLYQEFRDQKAAFFIAKLKQGRHLIRYELRAEDPGIFHAMPDQAHAMYVPEIRANSDEMRVTVQDPKPASSGKE